MVEKLYSVKKKNQSKTIGGKIIWWSCRTALTPFLHHTFLWSPVLSVRIPQKCVVHKGFGAPRGAPSPLNKIVFIVFPLVRTKILCLFPLWDIQKGIGFHTPFFDIHKKKKNEY